ncbi:hypothetical protein [Flavobacterium salmonis]|nr:hypothetical protein [Flavobacterium salmonis]
MVQLVGHTSETGVLSWIAGHKFAAPLKPQSLMIDSKHGNNFPDFFDTTVPIMSNRLIASLVTLGVDNMDTYPVVLHNNVSGQDVFGYSAVNVIGCIDAEKLEGSEYRLRFGEPYFTGAIVIDELKVRDLTFFRTLYGPGFIVISKNIADALKTESWSGILLQKTEDYEGV